MSNTANPARGEDVELTVDENEICGEDEIDDDGLMDPELDPHCFGHRFHWAEFFFFFTTIAGIVGASVEFEDAYIIYSGVYAGVAGIGTMLIWNLVSLKRIAAASDQLATDVRKLKQENQRAKDLQSQLKEQDKQMKGNLADLEKAELLLKGNVNNLEGIQKQEEEMLSEREELMAQRREIAAKLTKNMASLWKLTIEKAKEELHKRAIMLYDDIAIDDLIKVDSEEFAQLTELLEGYGVLMDDDGTDDFSLTKMAGDDRELNFDEYSEWLDHALDAHFINLEAALHRNETMRQQIKNAEGNSRLKNLPKMRETHAKAISNIEVKVNM